MSKLKIYDRTYLFFITLTVQNHVPLFYKTVFRKIVIDNLKFCVENKGLRIFAYAIMPTHLHLIVFDLDYDNKRLKRTLAQFRSFTAHEIMKSIREMYPQEKVEMFADKTSSDRAYRIWADGYHPIGLENTAMADQKFNYIHQNPYRAGLSDDEKQWEFTSEAYWERGERGVLPIHHYLNVEDDEVE